MNGSATQLDSAIEYEQSIQRMKEYLIVFMNQRIT